MSLYLWNIKDYFHTMPSVKVMNAMGRKQWDAGINNKPLPNSNTGESKLIFTMPSFARHGRWGNIVFQYLFIQILARNNNGEIELSKEEEGINERMSLYDDMSHIAVLQTNPGAVLLDSYHISRKVLRYIPFYFWRAIYISDIRLLKCFILSNVDEAINKPLPLSGESVIEVEGLFMMNPTFYKQQHKEYILSNLFQPAAAFQHLIDSCVQNFGQGKTIIGIHIRRGDYVQNPLQQFFMIPIPSKYIIEWLSSHLPSIPNPVIYVCSDDSNAYKEIELAGFPVFCTDKLLPKDEPEFKYEQLDWEILRRCDIVLTSNSTFSFSAAFLNIKSPTCYRFSLPKKTFIRFDPWESEPVQALNYAPHYVWNYLYRRFKLNRNMVSLRAACRQLVKDVKEVILWKATKLNSLYYVYGISFPFFRELFNLVELFRIAKRETNYTTHHPLNNI